MNGYETIHIKDARMIRCGNQEILYCNASFYKRPYAITPTEGEAHDFRQCTGCQAVRARIVELLTERHKNFPNCCDFHSKLNTLPEFNPAHFEGICESVADKIIYAYQHILNHQNSDDWKKEISDYLEYAKDSFGSFPYECGPPLYYETFREDLIHILENNETTVKKNVLAFVKQSLTEKAGDSNPEAGKPLELLIKLYNRWLEVFPFELPVFSKAKEYCQNVIPLFAKEVQVNKYSNIAKATLYTEDMMADFLLRMSNDLLSRVDLTQINNDLAALYVEQVVRKRYQIKNKKLFASYSKKEVRYVDLITKWLKIQQEFFNELKAANALPAPPAGDKCDNSYSESLARIAYLKDVIENKDGYKVFWEGDVLAVNEKKVQTLFDFTWYNTSFDKNREVGNGRGFVDFTVSKGSVDKTVIEFKLASNSKLKSNLQHQLHIYKTANAASHSINVIFAFTKQEVAKVERIWGELKLAGNKDIILIDCRKDNKTSASKVR